MSRFDPIWNVLVLLALSHYLVPSLSGQDIPAAPNPEATFEQLSADAEAAKKSGQIDKAIELFQKALQFDPTWQLGWWRVGVLSYDQKNYKESIEALTRLTALNPDAGPAWAFLGLSRFHIRKYERALKNLQRARELGLGGGREFNFAVHYHLAILFIRFGQFQAGLEILETLTKAYPDNRTLIQAIGIIALRLPFLPSEVPSDRLEAVLLAGRGAYLTSLLRFDEASELYAELVERFPDLPHAHLAYGRFLLRTDPNAALEEFKKELEVNPFSGLAKFQIANEQLTRGNPDIALKFAKEAEKLAPELVLIKNTIGKCYLQKEDYLNAIEAFETGSKLAPQAPEMYYGLARAYLKVGKPEAAKRARETFQRLQKEQAAKDAAIPGQQAPGPPPG